MKIIRNPRQMRRIVVRLKSLGRTVGFIPTMGALHEGHLSLIRQAARENKKVIVSIFVNPLQFGRNEDLSCYPRDIKKDSFLCKKAGVDYIFAPSVGALYPDGFRTSVNVEALSDVLCGFYRPGHFKGVATVVAKLFNIIPADTVYLGQKDAQQGLIIRTMARDLDFPVKIRILPIIREPDGLALSSRNAYLSVSERKDATVLFRSLKKAQELVKDGVRDPLRLKNVVERMIQAAHPVAIEYVALVKPETLEPVAQVTDKTLLAVAMRIGNTRLIDNIILRA